MNFEYNYAEFIEKVKDVPCPICGAIISDDGRNSNMVYQDESGILYEYYNGVLLYPHETAACNNHHHFKVVNNRLDKHIEELDGVSPGWILHDIMGIGK